MPFDGVTYLRCEDCGDFVVEGEAEAHEPRCRLLAEAEHPTESEDRMTLNQLVCRAASAYPDAYVLEYWDADAAEPKENPVGGDTLAQFIAMELAETFDEEADDAKQIDRAVRAMQSAADDLATVARALGELAVERKAA